MMNMYLYLIIWVAFIANDNVGDFNHTLNVFYYLPLCVPVNITKNVK